MDVLMLKHISIRLLAIAIVALTITGSYGFVVESISHRQWLSGTVFLAVSQLLAACAMAVAAYICPRSTLMFCWIYVVLVMAEIVVVFSGYSWTGFEQPVFQGEQLTLRLINREWDYRFVALILAFVALMFLHQSTKKSQ